MKSSSDLVCNPLMGKCHHPVILNHLDKHTQVEMQMEPRRRPGPQDPILSGLAESLLISLFVFSSGLSLEKSTGKKVMTAPTGLEIPC